MEESWWAEDRRGSIWGNGGCLVSPAGNIQNVGAKPQVNLALLLSLF